MLYTWCKTQRGLKTLALILLIAGLVFVGLRVLQTPFGARISVHDTSTFFEAKVKIEDSSVELLREPVTRAVEEWNKAIEDYNRIRDLECFITGLVGACPVCEKAPTITTTSGDDYNILVTFIDVPPSENLVADFGIIDRGLIIVFWKGADYEKIYQAALYLIGRIQGVEVLDKKTTIFGAKPATSIPEVLEMQTPTISSRVKPTTLEAAAILMSKLGYEGERRVYYTIFRAYDEPDFTLPALASPILMTSGVYLYSRTRRRKHVK